MIFVAGILGGGRQGGKTVFHDIPPEGRVAPGEDISCLRRGAGFFTVVDGKRLQVRAIR